MVSGAGRKDVCRAFCECKVWPSFELCNNRILCVTMICRMTLYRVSIVPPCMYQTSVWSFIYVLLCHWGIISCYTEEPRYIKIQLHSKFYVNWFSYGYRYREIRNKEHIADINAIKFSSWLQYLSTVCCKHRLPEMKWQFGTHFSDQICNSINLEARLTNGCLPTIQIRWKHRLAAMPLLAIRCRWEWN